MAKQSDSYEQQLKQALKYFDDAERLTSESPLATAYFLSGSSHAPATTAGSPPNWGAVLQQALLAASARLWGEQPPRNRHEIEAVWNEILTAPGEARYDYLVLELRYFRRFFRPRSLQQIWEEFLQQSRAEFYRDVDRAVERLGSALLHVLRPGARLEAVPAASSLVGRTGLLQQAVQTLGAGKSIALSGPSGAGKTSLAATIAAQWPTETVFWFTVRPELTDRLYDLLFALGSFLHRHSADLLWRTLVAGQGKIDEPALLLNLAVSDLKSLADRQPLLILDEVDLWDDPDDVNRAVHEFVVGLRRAAPLLMVGQRVDLGADLHATVGDFDVATATRLLARNGLDLEAPDVVKLHEVTGGNPRLLWLCVDLIKQGEPLEELLQEDATGRLRPFTGFFNLLWLRLDEDERRLLHALSAFALPAPSDPWPDEVLARLHARHLVTYDTQGGVALLPSIRTALLRALSAEQREEMHRQAAVIYAARAEYTLAAFHLQQADEPATAIAVWFPHREQEIGRGQGATASAIFRNVSGARLKKKEHRTLQIIRAQLHQLSGEFQAGLDALADGRWDEDEPDALTLDARRLQGEFYDALGRPDDALRSYAQGLGATASLLEQQVDFHALRGMVHLRQREMDDADTAARRARYQAEQLQGLVDEGRGDLDQAEAHYLHALDLATQLGDSAGAAESNRCLSNLYGRRGELEPALAYANTAIETYRQIGDLVRVALIQSNMAANYLDAGRHTDVLAVGEPALAFYREIGHPHGLAATACNLAEAHFELGNHAEAEEYAQLAVGQEEPLAFPYAAYTLALVREAAGQADAALDLLRLGRESAQQNSDLFIEAYLWLKTAEILVGRPGMKPPAADGGREAAATARTLFHRLGIESMTAAADELLSSAAPTTG